MGYFLKKGINEIPFSLQSPDVRALALQYWKFLSLHCAAHAETSCPISCNSSNLLKPSFNIGTNKETSQGHKQIQVMGQDN